MTTGRVQTGQSRGLKKSSSNASGLPDLKSVPKMMSKAKLAPPRVQGQTPSPTQFKSKIAEDIRK